MALSGSQLDAYGLSAGHLDLRPVAIICWIKYDNFLSLVDQAQNSAVECL